MSPHFSVKNIENTSNLLLLLILFMHKFTKRASLVYFFLYKCIDLLPFLPLIHSYSPKWCKTRLVNKEKLKLPPPTLIPKFTTLLLHNDLCQCLLYIRLMWWLNCISERSSYAFMVTPRFLSLYKAIIIYKKKGIFKK